MVRAYRAVLMIGMDRAKLNRALTSSVTFSILPSIGILLGVIALSGSLGTPWPWLRLSVIGVLHYETQVAQAATEQPGLSKSTDINGDAFRYVVRIIEESFPGLPVSPYVMTGATDARCYQDICDNIVRFAPVVYGPEQMAGMHGLNETIECNCLPGCVDFYKNPITQSE